MRPASRRDSIKLESKVTSKGQITLPNALRKRLGIRTGSRIRFNIPAAGPVQVEPVAYDLEDLWRMVDAGGGSERRMSFQEMDEAKARRQW